ncbi:unnamed protein product, partial [Mesorhabditis belari]|uniref:UV-stimulated scaffold protein A C-terminal domain-containing protein n=1 Tax=Mesorhabditis belari TaxID=2138241 RepID=A0AAF3ELM8_9BILA
MEQNRRKEVTSLVNRIIKKNDDARRKQIDFEQRDFRDLREIVKKEPEISPLLVEHLLKEAGKAECPTRQLALSLIDYFFSRSHVWRTTVVEKLQDILIVFCELDILHKPLPPPKDEANELKVDAIKRIKVWHTKFANGYERLQNVPSFLASCKAIDYERASASLLAERKREEELKKQQEEKAEKVANQVMERFSTIQNDATRCLTETTYQSITGNLNIFFSISSAIRLLVPDFSKLSENESIFEEKLGSSNDTRVHGLESTDTVTVFLKDAIPQLKVSKENEALAMAVRDGNAMLAFYRKQILRWLSRLAEVGARQEQVAPILKLKMKIDAEQSRISDLKLPEPRQKDENSSDDENRESDFEDVPEKEMEDFINPADESVPLVILEKLRSEERRKRRNLMNEIDDEDQPGTSTGLRGAPSLIPTLSYGLDLKYWGDEVPKDVDIPRNDADAHRFWRAPEEGATTKELTSVYTSRQMTFIGKGVQPEKPCRARLANGKLCPRMDMKKCPIHGVIVERDDEGFPIRELQNLDQQTLVEEAQRRDNEEFLRDVEAATGKKLTDTKKSSKSSRTWGRRVRDVPQGKQVRDELQKKLLDKRTIARVSAHLDAVRKAKIERTFGHQYVHHFKRK